MLGPLAQEPLRPQRREIVSTSQQKGSPGLSLSDSEGLGSRGSSSRLSTAHVRVRPTPGWPLLTHRVVGGSEIRCTRSPANGGDRVQECVWVVPSTERSESSPDVAFQIDTSPGVIQFVLVKGGKRGGRSQGEGRREQAAHRHQGRTRKRGAVRAGGPGCGNRLRHVLGSDPCLPSRCFHIATEQQQLSLYFLLLSLLPFTSPFNHTYFSSTGSLSM